MPLYVKDREVGELAERLATMRKISKTEAVRSALKNEIDRSTVTEDKFAELERIRQDLRSKAGPNPQPITKEWIDSLYED